MKTIRIIMGCIALLLLCTTCDNKLDIVPKGKTTLENVTDLELLLNQEWELSTHPVSDLGIICNESLGQMLSIPDELSQSNTLNHAYLTYDEQADRAKLTNQDARYEAIYKYINYMNILLEKLPDATGDESRKAPLMAEARIFRAYFHWLLVNIYAQQYDAATAAEKGGIAYVSNPDVSEQKTKLSLEETYQCILQDCSDDIIEQLSDNNATNVFRADKAFGYAVRAKVLMQMKRYDEALPYALKALEQNSKLEDRSTIKETLSWSLPYDTPGNYVYMRGATRVAPCMETLSPETSQMFEAGDYVNNYDAAGGWSEMYGQMFAGISNCKLYMGWSTSANEYGINADRMCYTAAECYIRTGEIRKGLELVDRVRAKRVENYEPFVALYDQQALSEEEAKALLQKAKSIECISTYENFFDCKRWNSEEKYKRVITRNLGEYGTYSIGPDSPLWVLPFPANATRYNPSLTQNY